MIELKGVNAGYNGKSVLNDINITFQNNEIISVIGKNGCGKTTLLKVAANQLKPLHGDVFIDNKRICDYKRKELAKKVSFLPQIRNVPQINVESLVLHGRFPHLSFARNPVERDMEIVENALRTVGLWEHRNKNINELSGGERQKAYIAMVLSQDTDYIFLDEPTTYLDINHQLEIMHLIKELKKIGKTIVMVIHDISMALCHSDKVCLMNQGEIIMYECPQTVFESRAIEQVFNIMCKQILTDQLVKGYLFGLK